ncbi:MAG: hypothetical protein ACRDRR_21130 [Pseudonocardiaceae bacterium]
MTGRCTGLARPACGMLLFGTQESGNRLRPPGTSAASLGTRVLVEGGQGVARAWIDGFLWRRRGGVTAILALA